MIARCQQQRILEIILENPKVSRSEIAIKCGKSVKTIERRLGEMSDLVKFVGSGYSGHWEITPHRNRKNRTAVSATTGN